MKHGPEGQMSNLAHIQRSAEILSRRKGQWAPSLLSPSASLQLVRSPGQRWHRCLVLHYVAAPRQSLLWWSAGLTLLGPPGLEQTENVLNRLVVWHDSGTCRGALRGWRPVGTSFVLCFFLAPGYWYLLERSVPTDWHHEFWGCHPGDTPRSPGYHIQLGWCSWPHRMVYICILEKLLPEGLASNELKSRGCLRSSPLGLTGLGTAVTKNKGHYKQIKPLGKWQPKARAGLNDNIHLLPRAITSRLKSYQAYFLTTIVWSKI